MKIAVDVDGVVADFGGAFNKVINSLYGKYTIPASYQPKDWHWSDVLTPEMEKAGFKELSITKNFWESLEPFRYDLRIVESVAEAPGRDIIFLTARASSAGDTVATQTRRWLRKYSYRDVTNHSAVITVAKPALKRQVLEGLGIETMIDDHGPTVESFDTIPGFQGYLLDRPWNQDAKVKNRVATVREFFERIGCLKPKSTLQENTQVSQGLNSTQASPLS